jgi:hypothetical protein
MYQIGSSKEMSEVYDTLSGHFKSWGKDMHQQAKVNLTYLPQYFNYTAIEHQSLKDLYNKKDHILAKFLQKNGELEKKKDILWKMAKPEKWELSTKDLNRSADLLNSRLEALAVMLPVDTKQVRDYENTFLLLTTNCYREVKKTNSEEVEDVKDHLQDYAARMSSIMTSQHIAWAHLEGIMQGSDESNSKSKSKELTEQSAEKSVENSVEKEA